MKRFYLLPLVALSLLSGEALLASASLLHPQVPLGTSVQASPPGPATQLQPPPPAPRVVDGKPQSQLAWIMAQTGGLEALAESDSDDEDRPAAPRRHHKGPSIPHPLGATRHFDSCMNTYLILDAIAQTTTHTGWTVPDLVEDGRVRKLTGNEAFSIVFETFRTGALATTPFLIAGKEWGRDPHCIKNNPAFYSLLVVMALTHIASLVVHNITAHQFDPNNEAQMYVDAGIASMKQTGDLSNGRFKTGSCLLYIFKGFFQLCAGLLGLWITNMHKAVHRSKTGEILQDGQVLSTSASMLLCANICCSALGIAERVREANLLSTAEKRGKQVVAAAAA